MPSGRLVVTSTSSTVVVRRVRLDPLDGEAGGGQPAGELLRLGRQVDVLGEPGEREFEHQPLTWRSSRSSFSNSSRMLGMP